MGVPTESPHCCKHFMSVYYVGLRRGLDVKITADTHDAPVKISGKMANIHLAADDRELQISSCKVIPKCNRLTTHCVDDI